MKITAIELENVRGFRKLPKTELSPSINVFVGWNNSGKSTILNSIYKLQNASLGSADRTIGQRNEGNATLHVESKGGASPISQKYKDVKILQYNLGGPIYHKVGGIVMNLPTFPNHEPLNLIYPYLSKRKTSGYSSKINHANSLSVTGNFENLYSKIDRLVTQQFQPFNSMYVKACNDILGFVISSTGDDEGKRAVYFINGQEHIPLTSMGEGVVNIVGLIVDLCMAENKIFLIEEPENDIHPKALKALMNLIIEKSVTNQFFVSTHSNIVMKYLGSAKDAKVFNVTNFDRDGERPNLFISKMEEVPNDAEARRRVLEDLGYDFFDFDMWKGWLFLEESSAECIIRDYLIKWFVSELSGKLRTFSASGLDNVATKFDDFNNLFVFLHLEPAYKNRVWVLIDSGEKESKIIEELKGKYVKNGWASEVFDQFSEHDFESYYPQGFKEKVAPTLAITDKKQKWIAKANLLKELRTWIHEDEARAKEQFKESAAEVIAKLETINEKMKAL